MDKSGCCIIQRAKEGGKKDNHKMPSIKGLMQPRKASCIPIRITASKADKIIRFVIYTIFKNMMPPRRG